MIHLLKILVIDQQQKVLIVAERSSYLAVLQVILDNMPEYTGRTRLFTGYTLSPQVLAKVHKVLKYMQKVHSTDRQQFKQGRVPQHCPADDIKHV